MFKTFKPQYLNKLPEGEVRDLSSPKPFHTLKVECLGNDGIKPAAEVCGKFEMPISALIGNFAIEPCKCSNSTPPVVRTSDFSTQGLVESSECFQGLFQELWRSYFIASVESQIGVHTEIYPYAFTCSGQHFFRCIICHHIEPICSHTVAKDLDIADSAFPITRVVIQDVAVNKHKLLFCCVPFFERQANRVFREFVACFELRRTVSLTFLELWTTHMRKVKKSFPSDMQTDNHFVKRIARNPRPMFLSASKQLRQVRLQTIPTRIFTVDAVISLLKFEEVVMYITQVVKHIAKTHILRMFAYLIFIRSAVLLLLFSLFHRISRITTLTPTKWVGRHIVKRQCFVCLPTRYYHYITFQTKSQMFLIGVWSNS